MEFSQEIISMLAVQETDIILSNHPDTEQLRKVASNLTGAPHDYFKTFHTGAPPNHQELRFPQQLLKIQLQHPIILRHYLKDSKETEGLVF